MLLGRVNAAETGSQRPVSSLALVRAKSAAVPRLAVHAVSRLGWGIADQAVSSLTNFAVSIYIVKSLGPVQFGAFSLAYVTYGFALNASRGLSTDPLIVRYSGVSHSRWRQGAAGATGTALAVGLASGICSLAAAVVLGGTVRAAFTALGLTMPGLMLQDAWRFSFFAARRGRHAFINDSIWAVTLVPALIMLKLAGYADVFWFTLAWGATACIAAVAGMLQSGVMPRLALVSDWLKRQRDLGVNYLLEGTSGSIVMQVRGYGTGLILGLAAVGYVQASVTLMGPMTILFLGMGLVTIPEGARVLRRSAWKLPKFCVLVSAGLAVSGLAWGIALLFLVPRGLGAWMLHGNWRQAYPLVLPQIIYVVGGGLAGGAATGLHSLGAARRSLRVVLLGTFITSVSTLVGAVVAGAPGTIYGMALGEWISALMTWEQFRKAFHEHTNASVEARLGGIRRRSKGNHRRVRRIS